MAHSAFMVGVRMASARIISTATETDTVQVRARQSASGSAWRNTHRMGRRRGSASGLEVLQDRQQAALSPDRQGRNDGHEVLLSQVGQVSHGAVHDDEKAGGARGG